MATTHPAKRRAILAFMLDRPGVLNKVAMLIRRKMYNVETLTVCKTNQPGTSRMTLTLREASDSKMDQVVKQIEKITEVISAKELDVDESFWREVAVIKFEADSDYLTTLQKAYRFDVLDNRDDERFVVQVAGTSQSIDTFIEDVGKDKIVEIARSGFTAIEK
jgi:acetolactate synthase-1/3 small subunit